MTIVLMVKYLIIVYNEVSFVKVITLVNNINLNLIGINVDKYLNMKIGEKAK
jgi:hypothetical protein